MNDEHNPLPDETGEAQQNPAEQPFAEVLTSAPEEDEAEEEKPRTVQITLPVPRSMRRFAIAFLTSLGAVLLVIAGVLLYRGGYDASIEKNGTFDAGYTAAMREKGTYQEGWDAAILEKGTFDEGYKAGIAKGRQEGYETGYTEGHADALEEIAEAEPEPAPPVTPEGEPADTPVWVSKHLGTHYHRSRDCILVIRPKEITLSQAQAAGYTPCELCGN